MPYAILSELSLIPQGNLLWSPQNLKITVAYATLKIRTGNEINWPWVITSTMETFSLLCRNLSHEIDTWD